MSFFQCFLISPDILRHLAAQQKQADQIRDGHEGVGNIGEAPYQL